MKLPDELRQAYQKNARQFSWVFPLETEQTALAIFAAGEKAYQGERFFWQTPKKDFALVGFGYETILKGAETETHQLNNFLKKESATRFQNMSISGTGALLFGGLPFDTEQTPTEAWGELGEGWFYLPSILFTFSGSRIYGTLNFSGSSEQEVEERWSTLVAQFDRLLATCEELPAVAETKIDKEEVAVTEWLQAVNETVAVLREDGPLKKVVLARQLAVSSPEKIRSNQVLVNLMAQQQNTYLFALEAKDTSFIGATPERLLLGTKETFATACIAGTIKTGQTPEETKALGAQLLQDRKNTGEHQIVVERLAKELAKMTTSENSIQAPIILENRDVQHLYVPISGQRKPGISFLESVMQLHPTPALGGEPKELAVEWIRQYEPGSRGLYGAPIGWISGNDDSGEFAVALRSGVFAGQEGVLYAGCGIVADSQAELEREETKIKFQPMLRGIGGQV